ILTIRKNHDGSPELVHRLIHHHLVAAGIENRIVKSSSPTGTHLLNRFFQQSLIIRQIGNQLSSSIKTDDNCLVLSTNGVSKKFQCSLLLETKPVTNGI